MRVSKNGGWSHIRTLEELTKVTTNFRENGEREIYICVEENTVPLRRTVEIEDINRKSRYLYEK